MNKAFHTTDDQGYTWGIVFPLVMGYEDRPMVRIEGRGSFQMPEKTLEELAIQLLRSYGYLVVSKEDVTGEKWYARTNEMMDTITTLQQRLDDIEQRHIGRPDH